MQIIPSLWRLDHFVGRAGVIVLILLASPLQSQADNLILDLCNKIGNMSHAAMQLRQGGFSEVEVVSSVYRNNAGLSAAEQQMLIGIVDFAYNTPVAATQASQDQEIERFAEEAFSGCLGTND